MSALDPPLSTGRDPVLGEHGFWDYTTPGAGGMEAFRRDDYLLLLDDMAQAGMNSLLVCVKWATTGYRSGLPFLDQAPGNPVIESDNALLRLVIDEAAQRRIKVWLGAVVSIFVVESCGGEPHETYEMRDRAGSRLQVGVYDADSPGFTERAVRVCEELVELFPHARGLEVELEGSGRESPHRIPRYNAWAEAAGRPPFEALGHPLDPRAFDVPAWRDYTTAVRLRVLGAVEEAVRAKGFRGDLATIAETGNADYSVCHEVNLADLRGQRPDWACVTYEYDKWRRRFAMMDLCLEQPKQHGLRVFYLPRGVMTWGSRWPLPIPLEESWRRDVEDIRLSHPHGVWWFGCGTVSEGSHVALSRLAQAGYADGIEARRALLEAAATLRVR